jgi:hypothetical protein
MLTKDVSAPATKAPPYSNRRSLATQLLFAASSDHYFAIAYNVRRSTLTAILLRLHLSRIIHSTPSTNYFTVNQRRYSGLPCYVHHTTSPNPSVLQMCKIRNNTINFYSINTLRARSLSSPGLALSTKRGFFIPKIAFTSPPIIIAKHAFPVM